MGQQPNQTLALPSRRERWRRSFASTLSSGGLAPAEHRAVLLRSGATTSTIAAVITLTAAAGVLCVFRLGSQSFWLEEGDSFSYAHSSLTSFPHLVHHQANMAFYHLLLHFWLFLAQSEAAVRGFSVLCAVATIPVLFFLTQRLFGRSAALVAGAFIGVDAFFVQYAQEARCWALALFLGTSASALFVRALERSSKAAWGTYAVVVVLGSYAHFFVFLVAAAHLVSLAFLDRRLRPGKQTLLAVYGAIVVLAAPLAPYVLPRNPLHVDLPRPSLANIPTSIEELAGGSWPLFASYVIVCLPFAVSAVRVLRRGRTWEAWRCAFVLSWLVVPVGASFLVSQVRPIYQTRALIVVLPALVIAAGAGATRFRPRPLAASLIAITLALSGSALADYYEHPTKPDWRSAAAFALERSRPGDGLVVAPTANHLPLAYYVERAPRDDVRPSLIYPAAPWRFPRLAPVAPNLPNTATLRSEEAPYHRVWVLLQTGSLGQRARERDTAVESVASRQRILSRDFRGVRLELFR